MIIIGVDFHPEFQQMASVDTDTGEFVEKRLAHREEAETFYRGLADCGPEGARRDGSQPLTLRGSTKTLYFVMRFQGRCAKISRTE